MRGDFPGGDRLLRIFRVGRDDQIDDLEPDVIHAVEGF